MSLTLFHIQTLDGFIAKSKLDKIKWGSQVDKNFLIKKLKDYSAIIVGRQTFENTPKSFFKNHLTLVLTGSPKKYKESKNRIFRKFSKEKTLAELKGLGHKKIALLAGSKITGFFLRSKQIDEAYISFAPLIFGYGYPGFGMERLRGHLKLVEHQDLGESILVANYKFIY